ncbi:hypothetical protein CCP3SC5AM1_150019 [Gammaproteobacteria bacterium]
MNNFNAVFIGLIALTISVLIADKLIGERGFQIHDPLETRMIAEHIGPPGQIMTTTQSSSSLPAPTAIATPVTSTSPPILSQTNEPRLDPAPIVAVVAPVNEPPLEDQPIADIPSSDDLENGKNVYVAACFVCHETGAAGAPLRGDQTAWQPRLAQGRKALLFHVLNGFNSMPRRGGSPNLTENEMAAALSYLLFDIEEN